MTEQEHALTKENLLLKASNNVLARQVHEALGEIARINEAQFRAQAEALGEWKAES